MPTLYRNGRIYTGAAREASSLVVDGDVITWIGGGDESGGTTAGVAVVDLAGAFVAPAFVDAHVHTTATGLASTGLDLAGTASLAEALGRVEQVARAGRGRPIVGGGWDDTTWPERRPPTRAELDRAGYGGAVYLARVDVHSALVSSSLAAAIPGLAGLPGYSPDGPLAREAHDAVRVAAFAALTAGQVRDAQRAALTRAASLGIACVHEMAGPAISSEADLTGLLALAAEEELPEVVGYWGELFGIETARDLGAVGAAGDLFCDGSLGSQTAALHEPYADGPETRGMLRFATEDVAEHLARCAAAGLQGGFHAIGDAAIDQVLDAVDLLSARLGRPAGAGHRLEHAELVRDPSRLAASGLLASVQPGFDAAWGGPDRMYAQRLGAARARGLNRFGDFEAAGVPLALGSDSPVIPLGPWEAVQAAVHHREPSAAMSPQSAFAAHTRGGWRAARRDGGVLAPGSPATFAVWRAGELTDPLTDEPGLPDVAPGRELPECVATIRDGVVIYSASRSGLGID